MYEAKKTGKNRVETYRKAMIPYRDAVWIWRRTCVMPRWKATGVRGLLPAYHRYSGRQGCLCRAEALIRWNSAKLGFISPAEFIPLAEYLGLINPIGNYVLTEACTRCKH